MIPRIGFGFDVHQLVKDRDFFLGGVKVEHHSGALGHSDADVLIHALCDALLGAAALGDIGFHFPDTDIKYKGIDSKKLLAHVMELLHEKQFRFGNADVTLVLEKPKILPYVPKMIETLCSILQTDKSNLSIKATTNEKMGYVGREEGVCCYASVIIFSGK